MGTPSTGILDDFNRANGALGTNWETTTYWGSGLLIDTNQVASNGGERAAKWTTAFAADQEVYVTLAVLQTGICGFLIRDTGTDFYYLELNINGGYALYVYNGNNWPVITDAPASTLTFAAGDTWLVQLVGQTFTVSRKPSGGAWAEAFTYTDTDNYITTGGKIGLVGNDTTVRFDDFGGGTVSAAADLNVAIVPSDPTYSVSSVKIVG